MRGLYPDGAVTTFEHDPVGRVSKVIRGEEVEWSAATDSGAYSATLERPHAPGVVAEEVDVHQSAYSARWQELSYSPPELDTADPGTFVTQYSYDQDRRLTGVSAGGVLQSSATYDASGRQSAVETTDSRVAVEYEEVLQDRHVARPATISRFTPAAALNPESTLTFGHDGPVPLSSTAGGETVGSVAFEIDEQFRPVEVRVAGEPPVALAYNDDSDLVNAGGLQIFPAIHARRTETRLGVGPVVLTTATNLTELGDIELREAQRPNCWTEELLRIAYAHDAAGRITTALESVAGAGLSPTSLTRTFEYDALGCLTSEIRDAVESIWTYDENGNRTSANGVPAVYDAQDRLVSFGDVTYEHDTLGRRTARVVGEDRTEYGHDGFGALESVELPEGPSVRYVHDPLGRRIARYED